MNNKIRLVLLSFLMLFVELALIRWSGSNIIYLSYFSNFVLLGSFLGIGVGFLRANAPRNLFKWAPVALTLLVLFVRVFPVRVESSGTQLLFFGSGPRSGLPTWLMLPIIFIAVAATMAMIAEGVARVFVEFEPLEAYRYDIMGSILGIGAFTLMSFLRAPPLVWGLVAGAILVILLGRALTLVQIVSIAILATMLIQESLVAGDSWSPYYKVSLLPRGNRTDIDVNNIPHQAITSVAYRKATEPIYFVPYQRVKTKPKDVLIVGAGNGTDVAIALSMGVRHVDAVEIDPRLYEIGRQLHPNHPYQDPRVTVHINDGRAFLEQTNKKYDLILFALPDSLTLVAGQSSLRLESYLFTLDAMRTARAHLLPDGAFGMYNFYRQQWLVDRLANTLKVAYGYPPCVDSVGKTAHLAALVIGRRQGTMNCDVVWKASGPVPPPARDDYPFLYLRSRTIPGFYLLTLLLILAASLVITRKAGGPFRQMKSYVDLFFMGAAFLLLETKNVVQFALLFGTTWFVNALVFAGILLSVLAAVELARHVKLASPRTLYTLLLASLVVAWLVPPHDLLKLAFVPRFIIAVVIAFLPIFLANLVFAQRFKDVGSSNVAFGANLLGAMVGGMLEYLSLITGYRALLIIVALLYGLAFLFESRIRGPGVAEGAPSTPLAAERA
jgi:spermine/spermidine synthase